VRRRRPSIYDEGSDPDYRFSLANERTFLAWNRTALALIAGGIAVVQLLPDLEPLWVRRLLGVPLVLFGGALGGLSFLRWQRYERAMRLGEPLPASTTPVLLAAGVAVGAVAVTALVLFGDAPGS
jgi:putative membrane protein